MKYVKVEWTGSGYLCDPNAYLDWLDEHSGELPPGAAAFATAAGHYSFYSDRCPKSLLSTRIVSEDRGGEVTVELFFAGYVSRERGLRLTYADVTDLHVEVTEPRGEWTSPDVRRLGQFLLDELLPHESGCGHEIKLVGGSIMVIAADVTAGWVGMDFS